MPVKPKTEPPRSRALSADAALAEATRIIRAAEEEAIEVDWAENSGSDRDVELRIAVIRRVETQEAERECSCRNLGWRKHGESHLAQLTYHALEALVPGDAGAIGEDLYDAIERWREAYHVEHARNKRIKSKAYLDATRRDLENGRH